MEVKPSGLVTHSMYVRELGVGDGGGEGEDGGDADRYIEKLEFDEQTRDESADDSTPSSPNRLGGGGEDA
jgi:hypothetical protein